jgi:Cd2+/Zn2+-exporting ATPase
MIKDNSKLTIEELNKMGVKTVMLTGDNEETARYVADELNISDYHYNLMPKDKVKIVQKLGKESKVAFVGDGVNDAPVLTRSDLGISLGGIGSDIAVESSNIVLMNDNIYRIIDSINISKKVSDIVKENIVFAIFVKFLVMILTLLGFAPMAFAIFADVGVTVIAILNALRTLKL